MTYTHHTKLVLVEGGNIFKQGDHPTLKFIAYDSLGNEVDLTNKQIEGALYSRNKGIMYEAPASFTDGLIVFTIDELLDNGKFQLEFTVTDSADPDYRAKFPSDEYAAQLTIKPSKDNMDFVGVSMTTVAQLKTELQGLQTEFAGQVLPRVDIVEDKQTQLEADYQAAAGALTEDSEVILARKGEPTLRAFNDKITTQLAETVKKNDTGVLDLNIFDEDSRNVLQGQEPGTINAVLGEGNVEPFNLNAYLKETVAKLNSVAFKKNFQNPYKIQGKPAIGTKLTIEFILDQDSTGAIEGSLFDIGFDYFSDSQNLTAIQLSMYQNNSATPSDAAGGTAQSQIIDNPIILNSNKSVSVSAFPNRTQYRYKHLFVEFSMASTAVESKAFIANLTAKVAGIEMPAVHVGMHRMTTASTLTQEWHELFGDLSDTPNLYDDVKILRKDVDEIQLPTISKTRFDGLKANFLGDSITDPNRPTNYKQYYTFLQEELGLSTIRPYGVSSSTIAKGSNTTTYLPMCERYLTMDDDADLVTVFAGTNDYGYSNAIIGQFYESEGVINKDITTFYGACHVLFEGLINKYTARGSTILIMTPLPRQSITTPNATTGLYLKDYVTIIKEVAAYYSLPVLDLFEESGLQSRVPAIKTKYVPDGVHPNTLGHEVIANRLIGKLKTV